ncbi:hypothetical protein PPBDW_I21953 [Photobacterium kishitanii]|nr:hypothetical protein PPBDW_I21953 [Photobacterium kishitanii]
MVFFCLKISSPLSLSSNPSQLLIPMLNCIDVSYTITDYNVDTFYLKIPFNRHFQTNVLFL